MSEQRIKDLLEANNRYLEEARQARATIRERDAIIASMVRSPAAPGGDFQARMKTWAISCFGEKIALDQTERNHRFLEESLELVQSLGCSRSEAHQLVDYVFGREIGEPEQEVGGAITTLAALCTANGMNMMELGERELANVWTRIDKIREKQRAKPTFGPLPSYQPDTSRTDLEIVDQTEKLARTFMSEAIGTGYVVSEDHVFHQAHDPRSRKAWTLACYVMEEMTHTDPNDAVTNLEGGFEAAA